MKILAQVAELAAFALLVVFGNVCEKLSRGYRGVQWVTAHQSPVVSPFATAGHNPKEILSIV